MLLIKGSSLMLEAHSLRPEQYWVWLTIAAGLLIGGLKGRYIFSKSCRNNVARIYTLDQPSIWLIFRPWFYAFLAAMIITGATLSRLAHNNYFFLIGVAVLDLSIAVALLWSSHVFWKQGTYIS